jgi:hypothetical protein
MDEPIDSRMANLDLGPDRPATERFSTYETSRGDDGDRESYASIRHRREPISSSVAYPASSIGCPTSTYTSRQTPALVSTYPSSNAFSLFPRDGDPPNIASADTDPPNANYGLVTSGSQPANQPTYMGEQARRMVARRMVAQRLRDTGQSSITASELQRLVDQQLDRLNEQPQDSRPRRDVTSECSESMLRSQQVVPSRYEHGAQTLPPSQRAYPQQTPQYSSQPRADQPPARQAPNTGPRNSRHEVSADADNTRDHRQGPRR